jgi:hypothetical protein
MIVIPHTIDKIQEIHRIGGVAVKIQGSYPIAGVFHATKSDIDIKIKQIINIILIVLFTLSNFINSLLISSNHLKMLICEKGAKTFFKETCFLLYTPTIEIKNINENNENIKG